VFLPLLVLSPTALRPVLNKAFGYHKSKEVQKVVGDNTNNRQDEIISIFK
jgi:hypothetical protein